MGSQAQQNTSLADALFTRVQQRVLGLLFAEPDRDFLATEVINRAKVGTGAVHRELGKLVTSGLVTVTPMGRQKHYQANRGSPVFGELHRLILKTVGLAEPLRRALAPLAEQIVAAFVYGSVAKGADTARSDVDVLILSDSLSYAEMFTALEGAEEQVGRKVNPILMTLEEWRKRRAEESHFVTNVFAQPKIFILGSDDDLE